MKTCGFSIEAALGQALLMSTYMFLWRNNKKKYWHFLVEKAPYVDL